MLVLTRKLQEEICVGENVKITVLRISGNSVRIGIEAPREVRIVRGELPPTEIMNDPTHDSRSRSPSFSIDMPCASVDDLSKLAADRCALRANDRNSLQPPDNSCTLSSLLAARQRAGQCLSEGRSQDHIQGRRQAS